MKKSIAILAVFAFVAVAASAQVTVGAWGRGLFVPVANNGVDDSTAGLYASWSDNPRIGFTIAGNSDNVGFQVDLNADDAFNGSTTHKLNFGDQQKIWVKPMDMVTVSIGKVQDDTLRGNGAFGAFNWIRGNAFGDGEDLTFTRVQNYTPNWSGSNNGAAYGGFVLAVKPMDAFYAVVSLNDIDEAPALTENLTKNAQFAAGYTIEGIGQIRAQYITDYVVATEETGGTFQAAFKLTAVENLYADLGVSMSTNNKVDALETKTVAAYVKYSMDAITLHGLTKVVLQKDIDTAMTFGAGVDYGMEGGIGLFGDLRYQNDIAANAAGDTRIGFAAGVTKGFSNGLIGIALEVESATDTAYAIPVRFEYWF